MSGSPSTILKAAAGCILGLCVLAHAASATSYAVRDTLRAACPGQPPETYRQGQVIADPIGDRIFAANREQAELAVIDPYSLAIEACVETAHIPWRLALDHVHRRLYVLYWIEDEILVVDADTYARLDTIAAGRYPTALAVNPATQKLYVSQYEDGTVWVIDGPTGNLRQSILVGPHPGTPAVSRGFNRIFVPTWGGYLAVVDGEHDALETSLYLFGGICEPEHAWCNEETDLLYVSPFNCPLLKVIDAGSLAEVTPAPLWLSGYPASIFGSEGLRRAFVPAETTMTVIGPELTVTQVVPLGTYYGVHGSSHEVTGRLFVEASRPPPPAVDSALMVIAEEQGGVDGADHAARTAPQAPELHHEPMPLRSSSKIVCRFPVDDAVRLIVYDSSGRLVRMIHDGPLASGVHQFEWDGRATEGRPAASGVYYYRLETSTATLTRRAVLVR
jgi:hypothetical protein